MWRSNAIRAGEGFYSNRLPSDWGGSDPGSKMLSWEIHSKCIRVVCLPKDSQDYTSACSLYVGMLYARIRASSFRHKSSRSLIYRSHPKSCNFQCLGLKMLPSHKMRLLLVYRHVQYPHDPHIKVPLYLQCSLSWSPLNSFLTYFEAMDMAFLKVKRGISGSNLPKFGSIVRTCQNL